MSTLTLYRPLPDPTTGQPITTGRVHLDFFTELANPADVHKLAITKPHLQPPAMANVLLLNAEMLVSPLHLHAALQRAFFHHATQTMKTRALGSEIMYWLSPGNNVGASITQFGVSKEAESVVAVRVLPLPHSNDKQDDQGDNDDDAMAVVFNDDELDLAHHIRGKREAVERIGSTCKVAKLADLCGVDPATASNHQEFVLELIEMIALKGHLSN